MFFVMLTAKYPQSWDKSSASGAFQTHLITVELKDGEGNLIENSQATIQIQPGSSGAYIDFGDGVMNADGTESMEMLPKNHRFRLT